MYFIWITFNKTVNLESSTALFCEFYHYYEIPYNIPSVNNYSLLLDTRLQIFVTMEPNLLKLSSNLWESFLQCIYANHNFIPLFLHRYILHLIETLKSNSWLQILALLIIKIQKYVDIKDYLPTIVKCF